MFLEKKYFTYIITFFIGTSQVFSQNEEVKIIYEVPTQIPIEEVQVSTKSAADLDMPVPDAPSSGTGYYSVRYNREPIGYSKELFYIYDRTKSDSDGSGAKYGVLKADKLVLPMIFSKTYYGGYDETNKLLQLSIGYCQGLYDLENEIWTVPIKYQSLTALSGDLYIANFQSSYGVINVKDEVVIPFQFTSLSKMESSSDYLYASTSSYNRGIYNIPNKRYMIPPYTSIESVGGGYFRVNSKQGYNIVNINDKPKFKNWYELIITNRNSRNYIVKLDGKMGIIDDNEKIIVPFVYREINPNPYSDGSYLAKNDKNKYGCIQMDGNITLPFEYDFINSENYYNNSIISKKDNKCGIIQVNNGKPVEILTCDYDTIIKSSNYLVISKKNKFGLIDMVGKNIIPVEYDKIEQIEGGYELGSVFIANKGKNTFIIDNTGKQINNESYSKIEKLISPQYNYSNSNSKYLKYVNTSGKVGIIDYYGTKVTENLFDDIEFGTNDFLVFVENGKRGYYNILGRKVVFAPTYDFIVQDSNSKTLLGFKGSEVYLLDTRNGVAKKMN